jgi:hypothetical protein
MSLSGRGLALFWVVMVLCYSVWAAVSQETKTGQDVATQLSRLKTSQLMDRLVDFSSEGIGFHATAWATGFMALDEDPEFHGGVLGSSKPEISPTMRELVRRGAKALPDLIDHLDDTRATKLVVREKGKGFSFSAMWHSDEYDPHYRDPKKHPPGVNSTPHISDKNVVEKYNLRVGDLCYVAIGQIVNRQLYAVRYQPSACLVINSPVETPSLAAAVRKDWSGLTAEAHRLSLTHDALDPWPYAAPAALKRLCFYYPQAGDALARRLLARPLYAPIALRDFAVKRLVKERDPMKWDALIEEFKKDQGPAAVEALPYWMHSINWESFLKGDKEALAAKDIATQILAKRFPHYNPRSLRSSRRWSRSKQQTWCGDCMVFVRLRSITQSTTYSAKQPHSKRRGRTIAYCATGWRWLAWSGFPEKGSKTSFVHFVKGKSKKLNRRRLPSSNRENC